MTLRLRAGVSTADTDYGSALLDLDTGEYFNLNPTGTLVLHRLLEGDSPGQAAHRLTQEYPVAREQAERDVDDLIAALVAAGLIETAAVETRRGGRARRGGLRGKGRPG